MGYYVIRSSDYLEHHGILGMKWGVWNDETRARRMGIHKQRTDQDETEEKRKRELTDKQKRLLKVGAIATASILASAGATYLIYSVKRKKLEPLAVTSFNFGTNIDVESLSSKARIISKNSKFQRISSKSTEDYIKDGSSYISHLQKDNAIYKHNMSNFIEDTIDLKTGKTLKPFVHNMKFKRDIKIASDKDVAEVYMKINKIDKIDAGYFTRFIRNLVYRDNDLNKEFINELKSRGFDGIKDYHDTDSGFTTDPLFIFNMSELIDSEKVHRLGKIERIINVFTS